MSRPVVSPVLIGCVTLMNMTLCRSKTSTRREKPNRERESRSTL